MKKFIFITVALLSFAFSSSLYGEEIKIENLILNLPSGYSGPITQEKNEMKLLGFIKPHEGEVTNSLIQFSVLNLEMAPPDFPAKYAIKTDKQLLMIMLGGIERRRDNFLHRNYSEIVIAGIPANRIEWTGYVGNQKWEGIYYTLITGKKLIAISLQDVSPYSDENLPIMKKAIENIKK